MQRHVLIVVMVPCVLLGTLTHESAAQCSNENHWNCDADETGPQICVCWDNVAAKPEVLIDFIFLLGDPNNPGVELIEGRTDTDLLLEWRVWSRVSESDPTPANIGSVRAFGPEDYDVLLFSPTYLSGAINIADINLDPSDETNFSNLSASIHGDVTGQVLLQQSSGFEGGEVGAIVISGNLEGSIPHSLWCSDPSATWGNARRSLFAALGLRRGGFVWPLRFFTLSRIVGIQHFTPLCFSPPVS